MRKYISILIIILFAANLVSCDVENEKISTSFVESEHPRTDGYPAQFNTKCGEFNELTVQIATDIFEESKSEWIFSQIVSDYQKLTETTGCNKKELTIYVVEQTIAGTPQVIGEELFCSQEDVETGEYRMYLVKACLDMYSMWKCVGLSDVLYSTGETTAQINVDSLREYYSNSENANAMSLFPTYFSEEFAQETEMKMAEDTAFLLSKYIIDNYGLEEYLSNGDAVEYRNEWLKTIGVVNELPWRDGELENVLDVDFSATENESLILSVEHWNFYMKPTDWLVTAEDAYLFVKDTMDGYQLLKGELEKYEIDQMDMVLEAQAADKTIHLRNSTAKVSQTKGYTIYLNSPSNVWHEMVHALMPDVLKSKNYWVSEGVAEFLSRSIVEWSQINGIEWKIAAVNYLNKTPEEKETWSEERQTFWRIVVEEYQNSEQIPALAEDINSLLFYEIFARNKALNHDMETGWSAADYSLGQHVINSADTLPVEIDGNALSYIEAYLMIQYLTEKYDMESVIMLGMDTADFDTIFGVDYEQEYAEWQITLISEKNTK